MTTPGQQLTPGDDQNPPVFGVPEGAYVGDAGSPNAITDLNNLTEAEAKNRMKSQVAPSFIAQRNGVWGFFSLVTGVVQGVVDVVVAGVNAIVDGIHQIAASIGSLFGMSSRDMAAVDAARVAAENAIVDNLGNALDQLDEVQRAGGAYMDYEKFQIGGGGFTPHVLPMSAPMTLQEGTRWIAPASPLSHSYGHFYSNSTASYRGLATGSGCLELLESGFWRIDFQAAVLQANNYYAEPAEVWCYVTAADSSRYPIGAPGLAWDGTPLSNPNDYSSYDQFTGEFSTSATGDILAFGRAAAYVDQLETDWSGGNTISGTVFALLPEGNWKVSLSCAAFEHFSGGASTFVMATKINSESLRDEIENLKVQLANALPGEGVSMDLDEDAIAAMVAEAEGIHVDDVIVPTDPPENSNG